MDKGAVEPEEAGDWASGLHQTHAPSVTSAELVRTFGYWRQQAEHGPVFVSHHGRDTHVLLTKAQYDHFASREGGATADPYRLMTDLTDRIAQGFVLLDAEMRIIIINTAACTAAQVHPADVLGRHATDAFPALRRSFLYPKVLRALHQRESSAADAPLVDHNDAWVHFETFPFDGGVACLFRNITEEVRSHRLADVKAAMIKAMELNGRVGHVRVSSRGIINRVDPAFQSMLKLPEDRLLGVPLVDVVAKSDRVAMRDSLEEVLGHGTPQTLELRLLANDGSLVTIRAAIVELRGEYASEGAVMVATAQTH